MGLFNLDRSSNELLQVLSFAIDESLFILGTLDAKLAWGVERDIKSISQLVRVLFSILLTALIGKLRDSIYDVDKLINF